MRRTSQSRNDDADGPPQVAPSLLNAYRATHYCVTAVAQPFVMRIDVPSPDLAACHADHGVASSAFITACNPRSTRVSHEANEAAQQRLVEEIARRGYDPLEGLGVDPTGEWPAEPSLFVPGIALQVAVAIGREFDQNGIVWAGEDSTPRLVMLR